MEPTSHRPVRARRTDASGRTRRVVLTPTADGWVERPWGRHVRDTSLEAGVAVRHASLDRVHVGGTERDVRLTVWVADGSARRYSGGLALLGLAQAALDARAREISERP